MGKGLYENFFKGYTIKQWGLDPRELSAAILKRLPVRFNYDDNYYNSSFQGIPENGYTALVEQILDQSNIIKKLSSKFLRQDSEGFDHVFYTGPIDSFYNYSKGQLGYRTVTFEKEVHTGDFQGNAVINYTDQKVPYTRIAEHKHFAPWEKHEKTAVFFEYSKAATADDDPFYPLNLDADKAIIEKYVKLANAEKNISFLGRLATYRYLDMHLVVAEALEFFDQWNESFENSGPLPVFPAAFAGEAG